MSLKKPAGIPKIPKTRKKNIQSILNAIPLKKPDKVEFVCKLFYKYDNKLKKQFIAFVIETIVEFTAFAYEISVETLINKKEINIIITGLKAIMNSVPVIQPAKKEILFEDLFGGYIINVVKQDGTINSAEINFNSFKNEITIQSVFIPKKKNNRLFCEFVVDADMFTFPTKK